MENLNNILNLIEGDGFIPVAEKLYGYYEDSMRSRFKTIVGEFHKEFENNEIVLLSASGRTEISGNHTDHNNGKVLAAAIDRDTIGSSVIQK